MKFLNKSTFFQPTFFLICLNLSIFYEKKVTCEIYEQKTTFRTTELQELQNYF